MINLYCGTPGSGKSLHVADLIYRRLRFGHPVLANFDINSRIKDRLRGDFTLCENWDMTPEYLVRYAEDRNYRSRKEGYFLLIIDEAQLIFNARDWSRKGREQWTWFFSQHRKFKYDVILVAQFDAMLDKQIRSLIEYQYIHRKVSNFGMFGKMLSLAAGGGLFVCVCVWYPMKQKTGSEFFKYKRRLGQMYDTSAIFSIESKEGAAEGV